MAEFMRREDTILGGSIHGTFGSDPGRPGVRNAVMTTTTVESLSDSSSPKWEIAGILAHHDRVEEGQQFTGTPIYLVYACKENRGLCWRLAGVDSTLQQFRDVSIPNNVCELCDGCFKECRSLCRVNFGPLSSVERIGVSCLEGTGIEEVNIPDCVRELCDCCFKECESLRLVMFGSSSSLERIGVSCFECTGIEEVNIPGGVRELCGHCFSGCRSLCRVNFGSSSSLERIGEGCFACTGIEEVSIPDCVRELCDRCFQWCRRLRLVRFGSSSSLERIGVECFAKPPVFDS